MPSFIHRLTTPKTATGANFVVTTLQLPAGQYIIGAKAELRGFTGEFAVCQARLVVGAQEDSTLRKLAGPGQPDDIQQIHLVVGANLTATTNAQLIANMASFRASVQGVVITAELVQSLTITEAEGDPSPPPPNE
jgi:hypothetical protein